MLSHSTSSTDGVTYTPDRVVLRASNTFPPSLGEWAIDRAFCEVSLSGDTEHSVLIVTRSNRSIDPFGSFEVGGV